MSSHQYSADCPVCGVGDGISATCENRPIDSVSGECLQCGFYYHTVQGRMPLDTLNEKRAEWDLPPLASLPEVSHEWDYLTQDD